MGAPHVEEALAARLCTQCRHTHTGPELGGICIGCPCAWQPDPEPSGVLTIDRAGNPLCPGCHEGAFQAAARGNSGMGVCGCPVDRRLPAVDTRAEALLLIRDALDTLEIAVYGHHASCACPACTAYRTLRWGRAR